MLRNQKIIVLWGGPSSEAAVSKNTATAIYEALLKGKYDAELLEFHPSSVLADIKALRGDIVFNAIHGKFGEDGALQGALEMAGIPYTGSGILASAMGMSKKVTKEILKANHIPTADFISIDSKERKLIEIEACLKERFSYPFMIKASTQGSSIGVHLVHNEEELSKGLTNILEYDHVIVAEAYLQGAEFTVAVLNGKAMPVIQICPHSGAYDYESKYTAGATDYLVPAPISLSLIKDMQHMAELAYHALQCEGVARVDIMTDENNNPYVLEVNTVPGMTTTSLVPKAAKASGMDFLSLCEAILASARTGKW